MKNVVKILCVFFLAICVLILIAYVVGLRINHVNNDGKPAILNYTCSNDATVHRIELSQSEKEQVIEIIDGEIAFPDNPSCPFSKSMSFEIDGTFYLPALDDCCLIQIGNTGRYIRISEKEKHLLMEIVDRHADVKTGDGTKPLKKWVF